MFFFSFPFVAKQHFVFVHGKLIIESLLVRPSVFPSHLVVYNVNAVVFVVNAANTIIVVVLIIDRR